MFHFTRTWMYQFQIVTVWYMFWICYVSCYDLITDKYLFNICRMTFTSFKIFTSWIFFSFFFHLTSLNIVSPAQSKTVASSALVAQRDQHLNRCCRLRSLEKWSCSLCAYTSVLLYHARKRTWPLWPCAWQLALVVMVTSALHYLKP